MTTVQITKDNFEATIKDNAMVIFDFWAPWCGPCRVFGPTFEKASEQHEDFVFGKINTEEEPELGAALNIASIPTIMIFKEQIRVFSNPGALPAEALDSLLSKVRELDMDEVRKKIAQEEASQSSPA